MNIDYVKGFIEGEGCFSISMSKSKKYYRPYPKFTIVLNERDRIILEHIQQFFDNAGKIYKLKTKKLTNTKSLQLYSLYYAIYNSKDLLKIIKKLGNNPFIGKKNITYMNWQKAVLLVVNKKHLTKKGLTSILEIRDKKMNGYHTKDRRITQRVNRY